MFSWSWFGSKDEKDDAPPESAPAPVRDDTPPPSPVDGGSAQQNRISVVSRPVDVSWLPGPVAELLPHHQSLVIADGDKTIEKGAGPLGGGVPNGNPTASAELPGLTHMGINDHSGEAAKPNATVTPLAEFMGGDYDGADAEKLAANLAALEAEGVDLGRCTLGNNCRTVVQEQLYQALPDDKRQALDEKREQERKDSQTDALMSGYG